jgi:hypothetical protein
MRLWLEYIKEREGLELICIEEKGFITYKKEDETSIFICDIFVLKEYRKSRVGEELYNKVIALENPKRVYGMTDKNALTWEESHKLMLYRGFSVVDDSGENVIYYCKEL